MSQLNRVGAMGINVCIDRMRTVCRPNSAADDARQVPARLHLPAPRANVTCSLFHAHTDHLLGGHVGRQEHQGYQHRVSSHGRLLPLVN